MSVKQVCQQLNESSEYVQLWLTKQPNAKEESLTDWLLFDISNKLPNVLYYAFSRHKEALQTGADWEWWILFPQNYVRFRVQAKKVFSTKDNYPGIAHTNQHGLQIDKLLDDSKNVNAIPLYALYSSVNGLAMCQQLNHKDGIFLAGGQKIYDSFIAISRQKITANDLLGLSNPFSCFACCPLIKGRGGLQDYLRHYFLSEITPVDQEVDGFRGLHDELPTYLTSFLQNAREGVPEWWEGEFESELRDFKALLIYDFRNNDF
jgi:hypothetical protein